MSVPLIDRQHLFSTLVAWEDLRCVKLKAIGSEHDMPLALYDMLGPNEHEAGDGGARE